MYDRTTLAVIVLTLVGTVACQPLSDHQRRPGPSVADAEQGLELRAHILKDERDDALATAGNCQALSERSLLLRLSGLVDLATEEPQAVGTPTVSQNDLVVALVDARDPTTLPVRYRHEIHPHVAHLYFHEDLNRNLGNPTNQAGFRQRTLHDVAKVVVGSGAGQVNLHREAMASQDHCRRPTDDNRCSLHWIPLADELAPLSRLCQDVFDLGTPVDPVLARFSIPEGEAYTGSFFSTSAGDPCCVGFPAWPAPRAVANGVTVAVPTAADGELTLHVTFQDGSTETWSFRLPPGVDRDVLMVHNHARTSGGNHDFAAHFALREAFDGDTANVPLPDTGDCRVGPPSTNPQCSPEDNDWP